MRKYDIVPMGAVRMNKADAWKKRPAVLRYFAYKDHLRILKPVLEIGDPIRFNMPMPPSWSLKKKQELFGKPHTQKPDIDNLIKAFWDALYEDDSHIWKVSAEKRWDYVGSIQVG